MNLLWPELTLVVVLVLLNAAFAGTEMALVSLRDSQLARLESHSRTGALLARLARDPNRFLATIQIGITLAGFLASAAAAVSLAEPLEEPLSFLGGAARPVAIVVVTLALAFVTLVVGELAPKRIAMQRAERWGLVMARPLSVLSALTRPIVWMLSRSTDLVVRLAGGDPEVHREEITEEELRDMVAMQETFTPDQRRIIDGAFEVAERTLDEVLVPRGDVFALDADLPCHEALIALRDSGHSRAPVVAERSLDQALGIVHLRQLVECEPGPVRDVASPAPVFPEPARVLTALREMQNLRAQMAFVVDEHGGTVGIVTVEDLVEELVGEIYDETDPDLATARVEEGGVVVLPGRFPIHDLPDVGVELPDGDYATVAGLVLAALGRVPRVGETVEVDEWVLEVRGVHRHTITEIAAHPLTTDDDGDGGDDDRGADRAANGRAEPAADDEAP